MVASKHNYWLRKSERRIKHRCSTKYYCGHAPFIQVTISIVKTSFRLPLQCIDKILLNKVDESLQKCAIRVGVVCLYIYFCLFLLARISEFPNVIMLRYACSYRYLSTQNNNNIEVVPNVGRLAIHCMNWQFDRSCWCFVVLVLYIRHYHITYCDFIFVSSFYVSVVVSLIHYIEILAVCIVFSLHVTQFLKSCDLYNT